jgi:hypothetical protein
LTSLLKHWINNVNPQSFNIAEIQASGAGLKQTGELPVWPVRLMCAINDT